MTQPTQFRRRSLLVAGTAAAALPRFAIAQDKPLKIGYVTVPEGSRRARNSLASLLCLPSPSGGEDFPAPEGRG
jgi:hypothetical protein